VREFRDEHGRLRARTSLFAECPDLALGKEILKKYENNLCRVLMIQHPAKLLKKRKKNLCRVPATRHSAKYIKNQKKKVCRVLSRTALGKEIFLQNQRTRFKK